MNIGGRLADGTEEIIRDPRGYSIKMFLIGCPLVGGTYGLVGWLLGWSVSFFPMPFDSLATIALVAAILALTGLVTRQLDEPVGDLANRGLTRVYGAPWIPFHLRQRLTYDWEPWRTAFLVSFLYISMDGIMSPTSFLPMIPGWSIWTGVVLGSGSAILRYLLSRDFRRNWLRR